MPKAYLNKQLAAAAGRTSMSRRTSDQQKRAGTALLIQHGVGYYSAMGKASAAARAKRT